MTEAYEEWTKSERGRASIKAAQIRYRQSEKGKSARKKANDKFEKSEKRRLWNNRYHRQRRKYDDNYRFRANFRRSVSKVLARRSARRFTGTTSLLGCSIVDFRIYLESRFKSGMTWDNYGEKWNIDHIVPCALFDLSKSEHQRYCFHFSNLRPMWASQNKSRGCRGQHQMGFQFSPDPK